MCVILVYLLITCRYESEFSTLPLLLGLQDIDLLRFDALLFRGAVRSRLLNKLLFRGAVGVSILLLWLQNVTVFRGGAGALRLRNKLLFRGTVHISILLLWLQNVSNLL